MRNMKKVNVGEIIINSKLLGDKMTLLTKNEAGDDFLYEYDISTQEKVLLTALPYSTLGHSDVGILNETFVTTDQETGKLTCIRGNQIIEGNKPAFAFTGINTFGKSLSKFKDRLYFIGKKTRSSIYSIRIRPEGYHVTRHHFPGNLFSQILVSGDHLYCIAQRPSKKYAIVMIKIETMKIIRAVEITKRRVVMMYRKFGVLIVLDSENEMTVYDRLMNEIGKLKLHVGNNREMAIVTQARGIQDLIMRKISENRYELYAVSLDGDHRFFVIHIDTNAGHVRLECNSKDIMDCPVSGMVLMNEHQIAITDRAGTIKSFYV